MAATGDGRENEILRALRAVRDPDLGRDIVDLGFVKNLWVDGPDVAFDLELTTPACPVRDRMRDEAMRAAHSVPGVERVRVQVTARPGAPGASPPRPAPRAGPTVVAGVPAIEAADPLAELLGALPPGGTFRYTYEDAVKLAGHSCPTVAGAYISTFVALGVLFAEEVPRRGEVEVTVGGSPGDGSAGPFSQVVAFITGAAPETGFGGFGGRFGRRGLLRFDPVLEGRSRFRRTDTGETVDVFYDPSPVPPPPALRALLPAVLSGKASPEEGRRFADLWQARVRDILTGDPARVVRVEWKGRTAGSTPS